MHAPELRADGGDAKRVATELGEGVSAIQPFQMDADPAVDRHLRSSGRGNASRQRTERQELLRGRGPVALSVELDEVAGVALEKLCLTTLRQLSHSTNPRHAPGVHRGAAT